MRNARHLRHGLPVLGSLAVLASPAAMATSVWGIDWTQNGNASATTSLLLTPDLTDQRGSAWVSAPIAVTSTTALHAFFEFRISGDEETWDPADGMAFVLHSGGADDLGDGGSGLGYQYMTSDPIVAVEFDTFSWGSEHAAPHVAIHTAANTDITAGTAPVAIEDSPFPLARQTDDAPNLFAWVDFDPSTKFLSVFLSDSDVKPDDALLTHNLGTTLDDFLGDSIRFGFTAATGAAHSRHEVLDFSMTPVPLPAAAWLLLSGLAGFAALGHRKRAA